MDQEQCGQCGKEIEAGDKGYCPDCRDDLRRNRLKSRLFLAGTVAILILAGAVYAYGEKNAWDFSWDALLGRPAAVVNGEPVSRSALKERLAISRRMLEREYGEELFTGDRGATLLAELERDVLEKMVTERLVVQEANRLKITVGDEQIRQELQTIAREIYGTWDKFQTSLKEDGISPEYMANHVRNLLLAREVSKAKAGGGSDQNGAGWLVLVRQNAEVRLNLTAAPRQASSGGGGSGCGPGGCGGCGGSRTFGGEATPELKSKASAAALARYRETNPAGADVRAQVTDYGCHVQVDIEQAGRIVKSYTYQDGQALEN
ncbi:MAG: SurA N-terminal domain-containing protein [Syntrophales bacterium]